MKTYKIHLIRHGATDANVLGQYIGQRTDTPLSPEGLNELRLLKDNLEKPNIGSRSASLISGIAFESTVPKRIAGIGGLIKFRVNAVVVIAMVRHLQYIAGKRIGISGS